MEQLTLGALKKVVAGTFNVAPEQLGMLDGEMRPLPAAMQLADVPGGTWITRVYENAVPHMPGSGRVSSWVFSVELPGAAAAGGRGRGGGDKGAAAAATSRRTGSSGGR